MTDLTTTTTELTLHQQTILVTGGSRGLGAAIAQELGGAGARIAIADLDHERAQSCARMLRERGVQAQAYWLDVGDAAQVQQVIAAVDACWGGLDAVINNAAIDLTLPIDALSAAEWERIIRTNLTGPFLVAKHAAAAMRARAAGTDTLGEPVKRGHIVNIASTASKRAWPNASAYHASKWGLLGLSHALHAELREHGIQVSALVCGGMRTPFLLERFPDIDPQDLQDPAAVARAVKFVLTQAAESVVAELTIVPMRERSWP